ncbi:MAG: NUDIX hydrolase [Verrucomicrobiota bacterium]
MSQDRPVDQGTFQGSVQRYRIGVLLYFRDELGRVLLIRRSKAPNVGLWCAVGGKLEMASGESPYECACREGREEVGVKLEAGDLDLRCVLAEKEYEATGHWLMFVFQVKQALKSLPADIDEGQFSFFQVGELNSLAMPRFDRSVLLDRILNPDAAKLHWIKMDERENQSVEEVLG